MSALFTLDQAKSWLGIDPASTEFDDRLQSVADAVTTIIENRVGPLSAQTKTYSLRLRYPEVGWTKVVLPNYPVTTVTSVDLNGTVMDPSSYKADLASGVIQFYWSLAMWPGDTVTVTYDIGSATVADNVMLAAEIVAQDVWQLQMIQQATSQDIVQPDPARYLIPRRALALLPKRARFA